MANRNQPFRQHLAARGLRAAMDAGVPNPRVEFHAPDGSKVIIAGGVDKPAAGKPAAVAAVRSVVKPRAAGLRIRPTR
jgi:hypothetical protein